MHGDDVYTVAEAARALKLTPERIRQMLREGEIEGVPPQKKGASGWKIPVRVIHGRGRPPPPINRSESPATGPESTLSEPEDISGPEDILGEVEPGPTPAQPQRDDTAENSREPTAQSTHRVTAQRKLAGRVPAR